MKKILIFLAATLILVAFSSCDKDKLNSGKGNKDNSSTSKEEDTNINKDKNTGIGEALTISGTVTKETFPMLGIKKLPDDLKLKTIGAGIRVENSQKLNIILLGKNVAIENNKFTLKIEKPEDKMLDKSLDKLFFSKISYNNLTVKGALLNTFFLNVNSNTFGENESIHAICAKEISENTIGTIIFQYYTDDVIVTIYEKNDKTFKLHFRKGWNIYEMIIEKRGDEGIIKALNTKTSIPEGYKFYVSNNPLEYNENN